MRVRHLVATFSNAARGRRALNPQTKRLGTIGHGAATQRRWRRQVFLLLGTLVLLPIILGYIAFVMSVAFPQLSGPQEQYAVTSASSAL